MSAISVEDYLLEAFSGVAIGASQTNVPITKEFPVDAQSALNFRADVVVSAATVATGITVKLQHRTSLGSFSDVPSANASVNITSTGTFGIVLHVERAADQASLPLRRQLRLVITTGADDSVTFSNAVYQRAN